MYLNCCLTSLTIRMLKYDMESKGARDVPQVDQPGLYLPSDSELQMAQVGVIAGFPVTQIEAGSSAYVYSLCIFALTES